MHNFTYLKHGFPIYFIALLFVIYSVTSQNITSISSSNFFFKSNLQRFEYNLLAYTNSNICISELHENISTSFPSDNIGKTHCIQTDYYRRLIILSGDVMLNPGPSKQNFGCTLFSSNVRSIGKGKLKEFHNTFSSSVYDILCITKTWLNSNIDDSEIVNNDYIIYRRDRGTEHIRGGGVLVAVKKNVDVRRRDDLERGESIWVEIRISSSEKIIVGCAYLPPP
jgi:hypothetical protein